MSRRRFSLEFHPSMHCIFYSCKNVFGIRHDFHHELTCEQKTVACLGVSVAIAYDGQGNSVILCYQAVRHLSEDPWDVTTGPLEDG